MYNSSLSNLLGPDEAAQLLQVFKEVPSLFAVSLLWHFCVACHLKNERPIHKCPYVLQQLLEKLKEMLKLGVLSLPIVVV